MCGSSKARWTTTTITVRSAAAWSFCRTSPKSIAGAISGVYHEAKLLDAPVLATAGTWIADDIRALGNGLVIENFSVAAVVETIARAQRELSALKSAAARVGFEARKTEGVARCVEALAGAFAP